MVGSPPEMRGEKRKKSSAHLGRGLLTGSRFMGAQWIWGSTCGDARKLRGGIRSGYSRRKGREKWRGPPFC
jgi:hypothetical protein